LTGEQYCQVFYKIYGLETVCLRYFNVFGPRQDPNSQYSAAIPKFIRALMTDTPPLIYGDGNQSRDFTYVDNVIKANMLAIKAPDAAGKVFNIAYGKKISVNDLVNKLNIILGKKIQPTYAPTRTGDVRHSLADISQAQKLLDYSPSVSLEEGLKRTADWFVNQ
jgi:UDP-glucose 4-epimerase